MPGKVQVMSEWDWMTDRESVAAMIEDNLREINELEDHTQKLEALYAWLTKTTDATNAREETEK